MFFSRKLAEPYAICAQAKKKRLLLLTILYTFLSNDAISDRENVKKLSSRIHCAHFCFLLNVDIPTRNTKCLHHGLVKKISKLPKDDIVMKYKQIK